MKVISTSPGILSVEINSPQAADIWSFPNVYGGVAGLAERVSDFSAKSGDGRQVEVKKLAPGEFRASEKSSAISYQIRVTEPRASSQKSHVSWLNDREGLLMMADLLPHSAGGSTPNVAITIDAPANWSIASVMDRLGQPFIVDDVGKAVFLIGRSLKNADKKIVANDWRISLSGDWPVSEAEVAKVVSRLVKEYSQLTRFQLRNDAALLLVPISGAGAEHWTAETRGNTVVLLIGPATERRQFLARLTVILAHELFHLWVPNAISLEGDYDWFFEGFTLYQALRTTQKLGLVDFAEYLRTIGRVYDSYLSVAERDQLSLLMLSERRWTSSKSLLYDRGMLVAFLYDLQLRLNGDGKSSLGDIYGKLFALKNTANSSALNGNEYTMTLLDQASGIDGFSKQYIESALPIELGVLLAPYGIEVNRDRGQTQLKVAGKLDASQRKLLKSLGHKK